jgi:DnaJ-class molecular chaperone
MTPTEAAALMFPGLGLSNIDAGMQAEIRDTFRLLAKLDHPDAGGTGAQITKLKQARDVLMDYTNGVKPACPVCNGTGAVRAKGFKPVACPKGCKITGGRSGKPIQKRSIGNAKFR